MIFGVIAYIAVMFAIAAFTCSMVEQASFRAIGNAYATVGLTVAGICIALIAIGPPSANDSAQGFLIIAVLGLLFPAGVVYAMPLMIDNVRHWSQSARRICR